MLLWTRTPFVSLVTRLSPLPAILSTGNVLKELSDPAGAIIYTSRFQVRSLKPGCPLPNNTEARQCPLTLPFLPYVSVQLGDPTLNALEIWGAEYQESNALLLRPSDRDFLSRASARERCPACFVGTITGDKRVSWRCQCYRQAWAAGYTGLGEKCRGAE